MTVSAELQHVCLRTEIDDLIRRIHRWSERVPPWEPAQRASEIAARILSRVDSLRIRLEAPLVTATFGGTGTGKSSLVNAILGQEITESGRQRPTTKRPVLLAHQDLEPGALGLDLSCFHVKRLDVPVLRDLVLIDCPDPDTTEGAEHGSNLAILRSVLPHCDVILYVATQQKYKSARISDELADAASGCRLVFVQSHADLDTDIREDWRASLSPRYQVPDMFFVDSRKALADQLSGHRPTGEFGRLMELLTRQLGVSRRVAIRRANLIDLLEEALTAARSEYDAVLPEVRKLRAELDQRRNQVLAQLTERLRDELLLNQNLWERRLLAAVTDQWGFSPFSSVLRLYNGLGAFIASLSFFRARTSAQMALIGAIQGARWLKTQVEEQGADSALDRLADSVLNDQELQEARISIDGYVRAAKIESVSNEGRRDLNGMRRQAARLEGHFLGDARRHVDELIRGLAAFHGSSPVRWVFEFLLLSYLLFVIGRIGHNFFWSSFFAPVLGYQKSAEPLLSVDFYLPSLIFLVLWSATLVFLFTRRLRRGLTERVQALAEHMVGSQLAEGLFPDLEQQCEQIEEESSRLDEMRQRTMGFRQQLAEGASFLGARLVR